MSGVIGFVVSALGGHAAQAAVPGYTPVDQGSSWTSSTRARFYTLDQGSQLIPLSWMRALQQTNGQPFLADSLSRYGYLPNENSPLGLPVGFTTSRKGGEFLGMTCAACHTRQLQVSNVLYRIDGGPGIVDLQSFLTDLDAAVGAVLSNTNAFQQFARAVAATNQAGLYEQLQSWRLPLHTLLEYSLPPTPWGVGRADALGTIFNRLTGTTLGPSTNGYLIATNINRAAAPVRYPFLWNSPTQDLTQWLGVVPNGAPIYGLARNLGEVLGAFAMFYPSRDRGSILHERYSNNSIDFTNLVELERLVEQIQPPKWPWKVNKRLAKRGERIFHRATARGGCAECHDSQKPGKLRFPFYATWRTPILDVGTDSRQYDCLQWEVDTGAMQGASFLGFVSSLHAREPAGKVVAMAQVGTLFDWGSEHPLALAEAALGYSLGESARKPTAAIQSLYWETLTNQNDIANSLRRLNWTNPPGSTLTNFAYESRRLHGIWAAAPYLHNGSVPTLAELLKPAASRVASFPVGPAYDIVNVGLATNQTQFNYILYTTDASDRNSGNSRAGREYGTNLSADEKRALLEYLKTL